MHLHRLRRHCVSCRSLIAVAVGYFRGFMVIARSVAERVTNLTPTHMSPIKSGYIKRMEAHLSFEVTLGVQRRKGKVVPRAPPAVMSTAFPSGARFKTQGFGRGRSMSSRMRRWRSWLSAHKSEAPAPAVPASSRLGYRMM
ncbi:hypothetical protein IWX50DRAFT_214337 [Phyllosticta citricarpa]